VKSNIKIAAMSVIALSLVISSALPSLAQGGTFRQNHPRRAEVLRRDNRLNNRINNDRGALGGHYGQLKREDNSIRRQEQRDARQNGGHITRGEQRQLNHEENRVNNQIRRDHQ